MMKRVLFAVLAVALAVGCAKDESEWTPIDFDDAGEKAPKPAKTKKKRKKKRKKSEKTATDDPAPTKPLTATEERDAKLIERGDVRHLRERARKIHKRLIAALPAKERAEIARVPMLFDKRRGSVNAFALCSRKGGAAIAISDGLLQVQSQIARAHATDEQFRSGRREAYLKHISAAGRLLPPRGFISSKLETDPNKRRRQAVLLDEGVAYVIGHELAHHRLSHTGCVGHDHGRVTTADLGRVLSKKIRGFNQPNELASDVYGTQNALDAGWTEEGGVLMLQSFRARTRMSLEDSLAFGFDRTHPHPDIRIPVVQKTAAAWRASGGRSLPPLPALIL